MANGSNTPGRNRIHDENSPGLDHGAGGVTRALLFFFITVKPRVEGCTKSMRLKYEPASEPNRPSLSIVAGTICSDPERGGYKVDQYRGTSLIRNSPLLGPYSRTMPRALWRP